MYEDDVPVFRRILWFALWFIVIVAVLWFLAWLIFFRETAPKKSSSNNSGQNHSASNQSPQQKSGPQSNGSSSNSGSSGGTNNKSADTAPNQLANTGAGDVFVPFAVATVAGTAIYYVRLRRKLVA